MHFGIVLENLRQLIPFLVLTGHHKLFCLIFKLVENPDFRLKFRNSGGCGRLVYQLLFKLFLLFVVEFIVIFGRGFQCFRDSLTAPDAKLFFAQTAFKPLLAALE